jgi:LuxR family maltose regulon positive regulatory protein
MNAAFLAGKTGRPAQAERWEDAVDRWQYRDASPPVDPNTEAMAATLRALSCRRGTEQMRADADEAALKYAATGIVMPVAGAVRGVARVLSGDLDDADAVFAETIAAGRDIGAPDVIAIILAERALVAMARNQWSQAGAFSSQAHAVLRQAGIEDALTCAVQARVAMHRGDAEAARHELVTAQRARPLLNFARPHLAVQARIELIRVHLALGDIAAARTLLREIDDLLKHRPGLGTLVGEVRVLRARLS